MLGRGLEQVNADEGIVKIFRSASEGQPTPSIFPAKNYALLLNGSQTNRDSLRGLELWPRPRGVHDMPLCHPGISCTQKVGGPRSKSCSR
jgi:hypothetical protein